jgi:hypothetical protein
VQQSRLGRYYAATLTSQSIQTVDKKVVSLMILWSRCFTNPLALLAVLVSFVVLNEARADELPASPDGSFSIVVIPDTQHYKGRKTKREPDSRDVVTNPTFDSWTDWIAANINRQRIVFVSHVGDIVDINSVAQWNVARQCMDKLHGKVPYGISVGNHDMVTGSGDSSLFQRTFPASRFKEFDWYVGSFFKPAASSAVSGNNANSAQLFEAQGLKFLFLHLECNAPDDVLDWADSMLKRHSDRHAIVTTHMGLGPLNMPKTADDFFDAPKGRMNWKKCHGKRGNTAQEMWEKCFRKHKNLFMICCGDQSRTQALRQTSKGKHGNQVHELLSDYGVNGLRVMRFVPTKSLIEVRTWDPIKRKLCESTKFVPDRQQHQFTLKFNMTRF